MQISKSRDTLSHHDSQQTLGIGRESGSTPGDSTMAFPCPDECGAQERHREQSSAPKPKHKHKRSAPLTGPRSTAELIPPSSPSRAAPVWLRLLDRHWNHVVPLWIALSLFCLLVLFIAVPTEPLQPAKVEGRELQMGQLLGDECAGAYHAIAADVHTDDMVTVEFTPTLAPNVACWTTPSSMGATATANVTAITRATAAHFGARPMDLRLLHDQAQFHKRSLAREQLCLLLVALTLFLLPLPAYVLVGGYCWERLGRRGIRRLKERI